MINLDEQLEQLSELIRKVSDVLSPYDKKDLSWLQKKDIRDRLYGKYPKCFLQIKSKHENLPPFFCVCNRMGIHDPKVISFSMKLAKKLQNSENYDTNEIEMILIKLQRLFNTYNKEIPKPPIEASRKGKQTRNFSKIKKYMDILNKEK